MRTLVGNYFPKILNVNLMRDEFRTAEVIKYCEDETDPVISLADMLHEYSYINFILKLPTHKKIILIVENQIQSPVPENIDVIEANFSLYETLMKQTKTRYLSVDITKDISITCGQACTERHLFLGTLSKLISLDSSEYTTPGFDNMLRFDSEYENFINTFIETCDFKPNVYGNYSRSTIMEELKNQMNMDEFILSSKVYVALENIPFNNMFNSITEKTIWGFIFRKPTVIVGPKNVDSYLSQYGFKSYAPLIDWGNNIDDPVHKSFSLIKDIMLLTNASDELYHHWMVELNDVFDHNYQQVFKMPEMMMANLEQRLEEL